MTVDSRTGPFPPVTFWASSVLRSGRGPARDESYITGRKRRRNP